MERERTAGQVRRRRVFYIPGYDPIHPRRYREMYRREAADQARISGYEVALRPRKGARYGWSVTGRMDGHTVEADVEVLIWSDIVRGSMSSTIPATYWQLLRTAWVYIASGAMRRLMWLRKGPVVAALYPVGVLLLQLLLACVVAAAAYALLSWAIAEASRLIRPDLSTWHPALWPGHALSAALGLAVGLLILRWFKKNDGRIYAYYLMHDYAFSAKYGGANPPALEKRMAEFTATIAAALQGDLDEVLVVGHSSGAHLAVSCLADLIRSGQVPANGPALSFLSLGQVIPMVSFLPRATRLRADLHYLSARSELTWVDVTAPGDGCAFALCDPVAVTGVAPPDQKWPLVFSAAFTQSLAPETWAKLKRQFFRLHFQYLCAFDRPKDYDYFRITAGPLTLAARYEGRPHSRSRIDVAASRHTSMAA
ncbi:hypothetical protein [Oceaniglobus roseus]|uniref:hypothetical protein n=1 Tax=Oceaniglobus roseus TaxID=1737570 RepID=UPI000C7F14C9|nr:hypothetical protein [Kandeliimicrobium roseum]